MTRPDSTLTRAQVSAALAPRGVEPASPIAALDALEPTWGAEPALEAAVVAWLGESRESAAAPRLAALEARSTAKNVKKEIKRALYKLAQRGLWTTPPAPTPPTARELLGAGGDEPEAWLSSIDTMGTRLLWMSRRTPDGVATLSTVVSDTQGVLQHHAGTTTRKALREMQRDLSTRAGVALIDAPWRHVDRLIEAAVERTEDRSGLGDFTRARRAVTPEERSGPSAPPVDALLDRAAVARDAAALASIEALAEPEIKAWLLPLEWLDPTLRQIEEAESSTLIVSQEQRDERVAGAVARGLEDALAPSDRRALLAHRLEESAYLLARRGRAASANGALAAALAATAGRPIVEIPLLRELAGRSLALAIEVRREKAREEARSSLVVTPAQAAAEQRARAARRR